MCDDHNGSPWISRVVNLKVRTTDEAFVSRFIVDFCGRVPAHDDDELCCARHGREDCWTCCSTTCRWQCLVRIAVGPATSEPGRPDRRGVRLDAWGGMTTHTKLLQGSELDTANEVVMEHGDTVLLKIPELGGGNFPGLGLFVEWPRMKVGALHGLAYPFMVMPVQQFPTHTDAHLANRHFALPKAALQSLSRGFAPRLCPSSTPAARCPAGGPPCHTSTCSSQAHAPGGSSGRPACRRIGGIRGVVGRRLDLQLRLSHTRALKTSQSPLPQSHTLRRSPR